MRAIALALAVTAALVAPAAADRPATIAWTPCPQDPTAQCGTVSVPVDWDRPHGPMVDLPVARRPATNPAERIGSLIVKSGNGSGVDTILLETQRFSAELRRRFDLVGFDSRGWPTTNPPVTCSLDTLLATPPTPALLTSQAQFDQWLNANRRLREDCRTHTGPLFDRTDTLSAVHDLDTIRSALGDARLTFYGVSYGTLLGEQYAERFPNRIRAMALDSVIDHSLDTRSYLDTRASFAQDGFDEFVAWSDRTPASALHGQSVRALWADLLDRAERGQLPDPGNPAISLTPARLIAIAFTAFYGPDWANLATTLHALATGTPTVGLLATPETFPAPVGLLCQDWSLPIRSYADYTRHLDRMARIAPDMRFSPAGLAFPTQCLGYPTHVRNPQHRLHVRGGPPILLANARHDPATGYAWATNVANQLGAPLLTYDGWGHGVYGRNPCTTNTIDRYLVTLTVPPPDTHCPA